MITYSEFRNELLEDYRVNRPNSGRPSEMIIGILYDEEVKKFNNVTIYNMLKPVEVFDEKTAREELKKCPKIVRDYVDLLLKHNENWKNIANKAISKLKAK